MPSDGKQKKKTDKRGSPKGVRYQPAYIPTDDTRNLVKELVSYGLRQTDICNILQISQDTLARHYAHELKVGAVEANNRVAKTMYERALDNNHKDAQRAAEYWLSRRAGWKETTVIAGDPEAPLGGQTDATELARRVAFLLRSGAEAQKQED